MKKLLFSRYFDKYGKPIYEGDIVRFYYDAEFGHGDDASGFTEMIDVCWQDKKSGVFYLMSDIGRGALVFRHNEHCEVIGNVYKSTELLKDFCMKGIIKMFPDLFE